MAESFDPEDGLDDDEPLEDEPLDDDPLEEEEPASDVVLDLLSLLEDEVELDSLDMAFLRDSDG